MRQDRQPSTPPSVVASSPPSAAAALPVAGSSAMPWSGANIRMRRSCSDEPVSRVKSASPLASAIRPGAGTRARPSAPRLRSSTNRKGAPAEAMRAVATSSMPSPTSAAQAARSGASRSAGGSGAVSSASTGEPARMATGTVPAICSITTRPPGARPRPASAIAVPMVGWPANGISKRGVKIRTRQSWPGRVGGRTKVVSEKPNSAATCCIRASPRLAASGSTANWLPPNGLSVNTSRMWKA